jgi:threonine synthase
MSRIIGLKCVECGNIHAFSIQYLCNRCHGSLDVIYDYENIFLGKYADNQRDEGIWNYRSLLPVNQVVEPVTLGEGNTPFLKSIKLGEALELDEVYFKNESINPTLSFKDRPLSVALTVARQFNVDGVVTASTGNTGVAAAAYAARADLPCRIYVPESTPKEKLIMMEMYGAKIELVDGTFSDAYIIAGKDAEQNGCLNLTSTFLNPFAIEGDKTLAYEIFEQYGGVPDWIVIPIGAGPLLVSCFKGFKELQLAGKVSKLPKMVGVQAANCSPIVKAFENNLKEVSPWEHSSQTIASGIADPLSTYPQDGTRTLSTINESKGCAIAVEDNRIIEYQKVLAKEEGIFAEPAAVTAVTALEIMKEKGFLLKDESIVTVITGHGLKDLKSIR